MTSDLNAKTIQVDQCGKKRGRFLLFVRCGETRPLCLQDYVDSDEVVVVISQYRPISFALDKNVWILRGGLSKFDAARLFFAAHPEMLDYSAFAFFDPDVALGFPEIIELMREGAATDKSLYQAAVAPDSSTHWEFLKNRGSGGWRELSFVEVMAPIFSKAGLNAVLNGFSDSISTWGLEYLWYAKLKTRSMAVNDRFTMRHDAAVDLADGPFYRYLASLGVDPFAEMKALRTASVGRFFVECEIPPAVPLMLKKWYVPLLSACRTQKQRLRSRLKR